MSEKIEPKDCVKGCMEGSVCEGCSDFVSKPNEGQEAVREYIPYGEEWEKEMMKFPKKALIELLRESAARAEKEKREFALEKIKWFMRSREYPYNDGKTKIIKEFCDDILLDAKSELGE